MEKKNEMINAIDESDIEVTSATISDLIHIIMMILVYLVQASCNTRTLVPQLSGQWFC